MSVACQPVDVGLAMAAVDTQELLLVMARLAEGMAEEGTMAAAERANRPDDNTGRRPLELAAELGRADLVEKLVQLGADVNLTSYRTNYSPLMIAIRTAKNGNSPTQQEVVRVLIQLGNCDVNLADFHKKTPLMVACDNGRPELVKILLDAGAAFDATDCMGRTAVCHAVLARCSECLELLISAGALVDTPNSKGDTPLHLAARGGHLSALRLLLGAGCDPDVPNHLRSYDTPLYSAAMSGFPRAIQALLEHGADPRPALLHHLYSNHYHLDVVLMAVKYGADVDYNPLHGSPVALALAKGWFDAAKIMILAGAERGSIDELIRTSLSAIVSDPESESVQEFLHWYKALPCDKGPSLKALSRDFIRRGLRQQIKNRGNLPEQISSLELPSPIKDYLGYENL